jgi:hypothetical protein
MSGKPTFWSKIDVLSAAVGASVSLLAVFVSVGIAVWQIRETRIATATQLHEMRDEAKIQHLVDESEKFDTGPLLASRKALAAKRINTEKHTLRPLDLGDAPDEMWDLLNECDHVGLLTRRGYLDIADVWSEMGYWLFNIYADAETVVESDRKDDPSSMKNCSWLIEQRQPIEKQESRGAQLNLSRDSIYQLYVGEIDAESEEALPRGPKVRERR